MNLFFKSHRYWSFFFLLITWESSIILGNAQVSIQYLTPWIQEVNLPKDRTGIPLESFFLDKNGTLFIGTGDGLMILEGTSRHYLQLEGPVYVSGNGSDTLACVARNEVGWLVRNAENGYEFVSRIQWLPSSQRMFVPRSLICYKGTYFFNTGNGVYTFRGNNIELFPYLWKNTKLIRMDDGVLLVIEGLGTMQWTGNGFREMVPEQVTGGHPAVLITRSEEALNILASDGTLYTMNPVDSIVVSNIIQTFPEHLDCIRNLNPSTLLLCEPGKGLEIVSWNGTLLNRLEGKGGLPLENILQVTVRNGREVWVLSPGSLHKFDYPSNMNNLQFESGNVGKILVSLVQKGRILLGTEKGVLVATAGEGEQFYIKEFLPGGEGFYHLLASAGRSYFAAGTRFLRSFQNPGTVVLDTGNFTGLYAGDETTLIASSGSGLYRYRKTDDGWNRSLIDRNLNYAHSFTPYKENCFFLCKQGVYRLSEDLDNALPIPFHLDNRIMKLLTLGDGLYLAGKNEVFVYEREEGTFLPVPWDHKAELLSGADMIAEGDEDDLWIASNIDLYRSRIIHHFEHGEQGSDYASIPVLQDLGKIIGIQYDDSTLYVTGTDQISVLDLKALYATGPGMALGIRQQVLENNSREMIIEGLEFQTTPPPLFRYRLDPGMKQWSAWSSERSTRLQDLKHGDYQFEIQGQDLYGSVSGSFSFNFSIPPPLYLTWYAYLVYSFLFLIGLFLIRKWRLLSYRKAESRVSQRMQSAIDDLTQEKAKTDKLVAEILPEKTAAQLISTGKAKWEKYERATVLFSDIQGFTKIAEEMNPEVLIDELDKFFFHFDSVVEKYNIEKIKTIGDAYMAAGGIPEKNSTNPVEVVLAALEMQSYMHHLKSTRTDIWDLRIGIHTGPVIAGVVGHKKVSYDIWGDTVNTASRMESSGEAGKVNISGITYSMVKEYFICEYRGKLPVKYKGNIDMYFVNGLRPELSVDLKGIPNKRFFIKLQLLRLGDLEEKIFGEMLASIPGNLHFHSVEYARKVYDQSFLLCRAEEIEQEERLLVRTAALILFTGLTQSFSNFENRSSVIAREILPYYKYTESQIDQICNLVLATKMPFNPNNRLEKILIDARMEYLGKPDYTDLIKLMFQELKEAGAKINGQQFKKQQLELLYEFDFYTVAAKRLREVKRKEQMSNLEQERWI